MDLQYVDHQPVPLRTYFKTVLRRVFLSVRNKTINYRTDQTTERVFMRFSPIASVIHEEGLNV